jgi:hypothetical protein
MPSLQDHIHWSSEMNDVSVPIPQSYLNNDYIPIVKCKCGMAWAIDRDGHRSYAAYSRHYKEVHGDETEDDH